MKCISSDTNVWFDYNDISEIALPFKLECEYIMFREAMREEIIDPPKLLQQLRSLGLKGVELTTEEFYYAAEKYAQYSKISEYDAIALSIAKHRDIELLTGDGALRRAAEKEEVTVIGSIGLLDRLFDNGHISRKHYGNCLLKWKRKIKEGRRLPKEEIENRLKQLGIDTDDE